tara:strand:- start:1509 stop:1784 length:276 start_codon:yes stop_codon:yes gene_type:complete
MTQYNDRVEAVRIKQAAEKWAGGVKCLHAHQLKSMWYDDRPADTDDSPVMDVQYNDGSVQRTIIKTGEKIIMGTKLQGEALVDEYSRHNPS